jgi:hypothetical protein
MLSTRCFLLLYFMSPAIGLFGQSPTGSFTPVALDAIAAANRVEIQRSVEQLMRLERAENWIAMADLIALQAMGSSKDEWVENARRHGSFFGRRLLQYRIDSARTEKAVGHLILFGCAKVRGQRRGYRILIEAAHESGEWRFLGPHTVSGIDAPPKRCGI